ncbi:ricin-type beta-trefoil lectin domain protein [Actinospica sp.]|uniref:ricin-type beta-trefoil lectin domain protein n=1 Tax=Actinospica sp. TaxID=1872142 RepID=UPI002C46168E|nr:ricin-type beta-trefoil lectin domain protein [Actinospica sp.]HWG26986.1 ricin-type beta-trefoil lectin domain protein [Actinospica sp.]
MKFLNRRASAALVLTAVVVAAATTTSAFASSTGQSTAQSPTTATSSESASAAAPSSFHGVNWADPNDNYNGGPVVPSGLSTSDSYQTVYKTTLNMVAGFRKNLGANTLRLPINPASVGTTWWNSYRATIDAATATGDKVILSYWDEKSSNDGVIDDTTTWNQMWNTVTKTYANNPRVFFEPMNEPYGYTAAQWVQICTQFLADRTFIPRDRVVISGTGYNDNVTAVGAASALDGTLLSLHFYGYWAGYTTEADWINNLLPRLGGYAYRTIVDEAGAPMTTGLNYGAHNGNTYTAYLAATTDIARGMGMGLVYWPGLRFGDSYSIESLGSDGKLTNNSATGVAQLQWGYGFGSVPPVNDQPAAPPGQTLINSAAGTRCADVPGFSTTAGTQLDIWDCNAGGNQTWDYTTSHELSVYGDMCMQAGTTSAASGSAVVLESCTGATNQQWTVNSSGTITSAADSALCLATVGDATADGTLLDVATCSGSSSQTWKLGS